MREPFSYEAPARLVDLMRQADQSGLINLAAGVPAPDALPAEALKQAFEMAYEKDGASIFAYHNPEGDLDLRNLLAARFNSRGTAIEGSDMVLVTGCTQGLQLMLSLLVQPGDVVACEVPAYYGLLELISQAGAKILPIPQHGELGIDPDEMNAIFSQWKPKCLFVCSTLSNPSGATIPESRRARLVEVCRNHGVRLVEDDIYAELVDEGAPKPLRAFDDGSTVSVVSSYSKSVSPGLRVGLCIPGKELFDEFATRKCQQDMHSSVLTENVLRRFIEMGALEPHLKSVRLRNQKRRAMAEDTIREYFPHGTKLLPVVGGYMLWPELPRAVDLNHVRSEALKERVVFCHGGIFFPYKGENRYMRLNCAKASEEDLVKGLKILGEILTNAVECLA